MLKLYHNPISGNSRRVWIALLEKEIPFEEIVVKLDGDQLTPEFLEISPFHHIPVLVDDDFTLVESLAILDYLETEYSQNPLLPTEAKALATVRMVEMVTVNELSPILTRLSSEMMGFTKEPQKLEQAKQKAHTVLKFFESLLGERPYFSSNCLTRADIVAGTIVPWLPSLGLPLDNYPKLSAWIERLVQRETWQKTQPSQEALEAFIPQWETLMKAYLPQ
ncbi:Glutathione S-transferase [Hyella patelloides LEGE 07179]|uniref:Glutathione S-transferase n=1 Tax=Hyella patelloides LEGE 07179 TaxID=945734 RepID=A0A563VJN5_9CYAN|nr:glutathione S-transferase family protein [Hyella patelloides]VEP11612.1 Glutathione S-transferase [Hyella patelloides LEGE 07179]